MKCHDLAKASEAMVEASGAVPRISNTRIQFPPATELHVPESRLRAWRCVARADRLLAPGPQSFREGDASAPVGGGHSSTGPALAPRPQAVFPETWPARDSVRPLGLIVR